MNTGFTPEVAVLGLSLGLLFALVCYLVSNLSPGGMITPGWIALVVVEEPARMILLAGVVLATVAIMLGVRRVVILYGKRLFATVVMVAVFLQMTVFFLLIGVFPGTIENTTLGFIVPGLIAYQLIRQPVVATVGAIVSVTALTYGVMLAGAVFNLIPSVGGPAFAGGQLELTPARLTFIAVALLVGFGTVAYQTRKVRRPALAPPASRAAVPADATRQEVAEGLGDVSAAPPAPPPPPPAPGVMGQRVASSAVPGPPAAGTEVVADTTPSGRRGVSPLAVILIALVMLVLGVLAGWAVFGSDTRPGDVLHGPVTGRLSASLACVIATDTGRAWRKLLP